MAQEILRTRRAESKSDLIPINRHPAALILRRHPKKLSNYYLGTDEGYVLYCSLYYTRHQLSAHRAHPAIAPIRSLEFSPFCNMLYATCASDRSIRLWLEGLQDEPILELPVSWNSTGRVHSIAWSPKNSTILVAVVDQEFCIWDLKRMLPRPASVTKLVDDQETSFLFIAFVENEEQLAVADNKGNLHIITLKGMPQKPLNQEKTLVDSIEQRLITKPKLLEKVKKLGPPFGLNNSFVK